MPADPRAEEEFAELEAILDRWRARAMRRIFEEELNEADDEWVQFLEEHPELTEWSDDDA